MEDRKMMGLLNAGIYFQRLKVPQESCEILQFLQFLLRSGLRTQYDKIIFLIAA
jgi:hypothetical protein